MGMVVQKTLEKQNIIFIIASGKDIKSKIEKWHLRRPKWECKQQTDWKEIETQTRVNDRREIIKMTCKNIKIDKNKTKQNQPNKRTNKQICWSRKFQNDKPKIGEKKQLPRLFTKRNCKWKGMSMIVQWTFEKRNTILITFYMDPY